MEKEKLQLFFDTLLFDAKRAIRELHVPCDRAGFACIAVYILL